MPTKLKVLVGLLVLSSALAIFSQSWVSLVINVLFLIGVLRGSEGARTLLILLATVGLLGSGYVFMVATLSVGIGREIAMATAVLGAAQSGFFIWCLRQHDVQHWMFHRKLKDAGLDG